jgi:PEP-CTERM motif
MNAIGANSYTRDGEGRAQTVPEPASLLLLGAGLLAVARQARRRQKERDADAGRAPTDG